MTRIREEEEGCPTRLSAVQSRSSGGACMPTAVAASVRWTQGSRPVVELPPSATVSATSEI